MISMEMVVQPRGLRVMLEMSVRWFLNLWWFCDPGLPPFQCRSLWWSFCFDFFFHLVRSLADFQSTLADNKKYLEDDPIVKAHLQTLYDDLLEKNLCRIIEPFSRVQVIICLLSWNDDVMSVKFRIDGTDLIVWLHIIGAVRIQLRRACLGLVDRDTVWFCAVVWTLKMQVLHWLILTNVK